jgi:hypothetical protein
MALLQRADTWDTGITTISVVARCHAELVDRRKVAMRPGPMLQIDDVVTAVDVKKASTTEVAESVVVELILDINPSKLQDDV